MTLKSTSRTDFSLPQHPRHRSGAGQPCIALAGNPNAGKTTLFNRLTGYRARTANFPGTTVEHRLGGAVIAGRAVRLLDLPGLYGLGGGTPEERAASAALRGELAGVPRPRAVLVVLDATNLSRNLYLAGQVRELGLPVVVALNMIDLARREGLEVDADALAGELGVPVVAVSARTGEGLEALRAALGRMVDVGDAGEGGEGGARGASALPRALAACASCAGCPHQARFDWAEGVEQRVARGGRHLSRRRSERIDRVLTHPMAGLGIFAAVMAALFVAIFALAEHPMQWGEQGVAATAGWADEALPEGFVSSLLVDGVIGGVGAVLVFLPQICILFFVLTLLEDTGYLARAVFVMDRLMRRVGLPGRAFVPMLSAHACAIPAIMSSRVIEDRRDRLVTILILPLLTCSARLPVYAMVTALLFAGDPVTGGLVFAGAYALGVVAALGAAWVFKRTLLPGQSRPLVLELPDYRLPSLRTALLVTADRARLFLVKAGTIILLIAVALWALSNYPNLDDRQLDDRAPAAVAAELSQWRHEAERAVAAGEAGRAEVIEEQIEQRYRQLRIEHTIAGRVGRLAEPVFEPLGFTWQVNVGVLSSFAAREVVVSTLGVVYGVGEEAAEDATTFRQVLAAQKRPDGSPVFDLPTSLALLVFFVLAMQCLPTQVVARRETGSWKWPLLQLGYMTVLAYSGAWLTYQVASVLT